MTSMAPGAELEKRVAAYFEEEIQGGRSFARRECCSVFHHKNYFSRDRRADIVFDVAIEFRMPGADVASFLFLIECKDYGDPVPVSDVEEFFAKVQQVGAARAKAVVVSTNSFQKAAFEFAQSKGIALIRHFPPSEFKWELYRTSAILSDPGQQEREVWRGLREPSYQSSRSEFCCSFGRVLTNAPDDLLRAVIGEVQGGAFLNAIAAEPIESNAVTFLTREQIEAACGRVHSVVGYNGGRVLLDAVCEWQSAGDWPSS